MNATVYLILQFLRYLKFNQEEADLRKNLEAKTATTAYKMHPTFIYAVQLILAREILLKSNGLLPNRYQIFQQVSEELHLKELFKPRVAASL